MEEYLCETAQIQSMQFRNVFQCRKNEFVYVSSLHCDISLIGENRKMNDKEKILQAQFP